MYQVTSINQSPCGGSQVHKYISATLYPYSRAPLKRRGYMTKYCFLTIYQFNKFILCCKKNDFFLFQLLLDNNWDITFARLKYIYVYVLSAHTHPLFIFLANYLRSVRDTTRRSGLAVARMYIVNRRGGWGWWDGKLKTSTPTCWDILIINSISHRQPPCRRLIIPPPLGPKRERDSNDYDTIFSLRIRNRLIYSLFLLPRLSAIIKSSEFSLLQISN